MDVFHPCVHWKGPASGFEMVTAEPALAARDLGIWKSLNFAPVGARWKKFRFFNGLGHNSSTVLGCWDKIESFHSNSSSSSFPFMSTNTRVAGQVDLECESFPGPGIFQTYPSPGF